MAVDATRLQTCAATVSGNFVNAPVKTCTKALRRVLRLGIIAPGRGNDTEW